MHWARALILVCAIFEAGWMAFDGTQALVSGHLIAPKTGPHRGELGPWRFIVQRAGVNPSGKAMRLFFAIYGWGWLFVAASFAAHMSWSWAAMVIAAAAALWFLPVGTALGLLQLALLVTLRDHLR
jgi:hypothetical protein